MSAYRNAVLDRYHAAIAQASVFALELAKWMAGTTVTDGGQRIYPDFDPALESHHGFLSRAVDDLDAILPFDPRMKSSLGRHLWFSRYYIEKKELGNCLGDADDIVTQDLPQVLKVFEEWYAEHSRIDLQFMDQLRIELDRGSENAIREAWPIFKTRMVKIFDLPDSLDGEKLINRLFGPTGKAAALFDDSEREGYLHLLKGLWAFNRSQTVHNDVPPNPAGADAVVTLLGTVLARIEAARNEKAGE